MLKNITILIFVLVTALTTGASAQKTGERSADEKAIRAVVAQLEKGWNAKSGAEYAKPFAEDADYVVIDGAHIKGRAANAAAHQQIFDTILKGEDLALTTEKIRFLREDMALARVAAERFARVDKTKTTRARITLVLTRTGGRWEIAAFQNTEIQNFDPAK